ncbi:WXG100-like domain-containing protein [Kitasatospora sp. NPDC001175]|uniref:WXG100-like domain-containing protein n=1 Tax=Kitasatospora sp. NPDC001175 TaxID=3157103 RepID=UPI003D0927D7
MIELPSDLAEVLKDVQGNEHGADIVFPNGNEELLAELAAAWQTWHQAADPAIRSIVSSARTAMANMSGSAADAFQQYYEKYAARDDSHAATTLDASLAVAQSFDGANRAVTQTKQEMIRELEYAKEYIASHPGGKHDDVAQSEGIKNAVTAYHTYIGEVGQNVDGMLRQSAGHVEAMNGAAKAATLHGASGGGTGTSGTTRGGPGLGGSGVPAPGRPGAPGSLPGAPGAPAMPGTQTLSAPGALAPSLDPSLPTADGGPDGAPGGGSGHGSGGPGAALPGMISPRLPGGADGHGSYGFNGGSGSTGGPGGPGAALPGMISPRLPGGADGQGSYGSDGGSGGTGGRGDGRCLPGMRPFTAPTPQFQPYDPGANGGVPHFKPLSGDSRPNLSLDGLGNLPNGTETTAGPGLKPWGSGDLPGQGSHGTGGSFGLATPFGSGGSGGALGGAPKGALGGKGSLGGGLGGGVGGGAGGAAAFGGLGGSSAGGAGRAGASGGSGLAGRGIAGSGVAGRAGGLAGGGAGAAGGAAGRTTGPAGMGGAHMPGGMGGGKRDGRRGTKFVRPTRFGAEGEEEEELLLSDSGVLGQATRHEGDRRWQRMRQRWLDAVRTDAPIPAAAEGPEPEPEKQQQEILTQLASAVLGPEAAAKLAPTEGAEAPSGGDGGSAGPTGSTGEAKTAAEQTESAADAYLDRARDVAARRGRPDAEPAPAASAGAPAASMGAPAEAAEGAKPERGKIREEGGYQVPSPFLRAALAKLATAGAFETPAG